MFAPVTGSRFGIPLNRITRINNEAIEKAGFLVIKVLMLILDFSIPQRNFLPVFSNRHIINKRLGIEEDEYRETWNPGGG